ncbi:MAG TPA: hypothetical protein VFU36_11165 [Jatrophihabitans sp.]|nr:hypothetical protein [Jatrophihabitans sp.]
MADEDYENGSDAEVQQIGGELHERFVEILLTELERERYPSSGMLDLLESHMTLRDRVRIANVLLENLAAHRYPSPAMLRRVARLVG